MWVGSGLEALGVKGVVSEEQMKALFGEGLHPDAGRIIAHAQASGKTAVEAQSVVKLGRSYYSYERPGPRAAVPEWIADRWPLDSEHTAPERRGHLAERYEYLETRLQERGAMIAADGPKWAAELGDVPADSAKPQHWTELAAKVSVFRDRYRVDENAPEAIPVDYRERSVGADLAARVTAMHTSSLLSRQPVTRVLGRVGVVVPGRATSGQPGAVAHMDQPCRPERDRSLGEDLER